MLVIRPANGSIANLRGQGPRAEALWRGGCRAYCWTATRDLQPTCHRAGTVRPRRFSAGPKPGRDGFSDELGAARQQFNMRVIEFNIIPIPLVVNGEGTKHRMTHHLFFCENTAECLVVD